MDALLTVREVAALMKVSPKTVRRLADVNALEGVRIGRRWRFRPDVVSRAMRDGAELPRAGRPRNCA
jgi:excisionase family DNA binding protein